MMVKVKDALELIKRNTEPVDGFDFVYVYDALERVVYEDVRSGIDIPAFLRSAMDGYGLVGDCEEYHVVKGEEDLKDCSCIRINTGFPIPDRVRAVAEVEIVRLYGDRLRLLKRVEDGRNFTHKGIEVKKGQVILRKGERISVRVRALLAYCGVSLLKVRRKPIVGIITTGDEVIFPGKSLDEHSVYNANYFILDGLVKKWLCEPVYFGHVRDKQDELKKAISFALDRCDLLVTTGGVSMGSKDFVKSILDEIPNSKVLFDATTIKPGRPAVLAVVGNKLFFGMPGWPSALYATAYVYLKPMLYRLAGLKERCFDYTCVLAEPMRSKEGKFYFNRVKLEFKDGLFYAKSAGSQKTDNFYSTAVADGLVGIEEERGSVEANQQLPLVLFDD